MVRRGLTAAVCCTLSLGLLAAACGTAAPDAVGAGRLKVVAAESPWGKIAAAIGGGNAQVTSLVAAANVDPHEYQPTAAAAASVAEAAVVVDNGLGYDDFMNRLLATGASGPRRVVTAATVLHVTGPDANPHLWYALVRVPEVAHAIEVAMAHADPAHAANYRARLVAFDRSLQPVLRQVQAIARHHAGAPVAQTERVAGYLLSEAGLRMVSPVGFALSVEAGQSPSASDTALMDQLLADRGIDALILNTQTQTPVTENVRARAAAAGLPVVDVTETVQPPTSSFVRWQAEQVATLAAALERAA